MRFREVADRLQEFADRRPRDRDAVDGLAAYLADVQMGPRGHSRAGSGEDRRPPGSAPPASPGPG